MIKLISKQSYQVMPWKNGQGTTSEIAIFPEGSSVSTGDFLWRVSLAKVQSSGPFSKFEGFDRKLVIVDGDEIKLNQKALLPLEVFSFSGEDDIQANLSAGPITDLGIISNRELFRSDMRVFSNIETPLILRLEEESTSFLFNVNAPARVNTLDKNSKTELKRGETLKITHEPEIEITPLDQSTTLVLITISVV